MPATTLHLTPQFLHAFEVMDRTDQNVFITGRAGTGKSTLLRYFRERTEKKIAVLAPTGVAAVNIQGQTIHAFFKFRPDITVSKVEEDYRKVRDAALYKKLDALVIDEISMVRADLLDCVDAFLRRHGREKGAPFGGVQMICIGDLYQLPPVVSSEEREIFAGHYASPYFFDAQGFRDAAFQLIELEKIYRQSDPRFIDILNGVRNRSITDAQWAQLNARHQPHAAAPRDGLYMYLTTTNAKAGEINRREMHQRKGKVRTYHGQVTGSFDAKAFPTELALQVKIGAQVMLVNNDSAGRWINGTVGEVVGIERRDDTDDDTDVIMVRLADGAEVDVVPHTWEMFRFRYDAQAKRIESETTGAFTQYPLMLAWAITIHKSQGKTFERVILDLDRGSFAHGQTYVGLSRCTSLDGLILTRPVRPGDLRVDWRVVKFLTEFQYGLAEQALSLEDKIARITQAIEQGQAVTITYLKANDEKSQRTIRPEYIGQLLYEETPFFGVEAYCCLRKATRVFRVDRILAIEGE